MGLNLTGSDELSTILEAVSFQDGGSSLPGWCEEGQPRVMRYGISAAALVERDARLLLVNHREAGRYDFWLPPGGRLEGNESIMDCARRETFEETGLVVEPDRILYVQEFVDLGYHFVKFFILCSGFSGELTLRNRDADESWLVDVAFFSQQEMQGMDVLPPVLEGQFWADLAAGLPQARYLGLETIED
jgi:8-oxo-dGTP diphosphatase